MKKKLLEEKMKFDSSGCITECFILPMNWRDEVLKVEGIKKDGSQLMLWGAHIFFGYVTEPILGTTVV